MVLHRDINSRNASIVQCVGTLLNRTVQCVLKLHLAMVYPRLLTNINMSWSQRSDYDLYSWDIKYSLSGLYTVNIHK